MKKPSLRARNTKLTGVLSASTVERLIQPVPRELSDRLLLGANIFLLQ